MIYGSVCTGIGGCTVTWQPLGWKPAWFCETEAFPSAVLSERFPDIPNHGDFTRLGKDVDCESIELLVGGTPCQSFSVAGRRGGLDDPRGNLTLEYLALADRLRPRWLVWENVPGVLSNNKGKTLGAFLGTLAELGYGFAYRVLDAQYFGLAQRRNRVFVVGYLGDWRPPAAVLFERQSLSGDPPPRRKAGEGFTSAPSPGLTGSGRGVERVGESRSAEEDGTMRGSPLVASPLRSRVDSQGKGGYAGRGGEDDQNLVADPVSSNEGRTYANAGNNPRLHNVVAWDRAQITSKENRTNPKPGDPAPPVCETGLIHAGVRRLTPRECERLQGYPDDWTLIHYRGKPAKDGPRYRAIGNAFPVPVVRWIGERIVRVEAIREWADEREEDPDDAD